MKICTQLMAGGIVAMISLCACKKKANDNTPEKTYTETFIKSFGGADTDEATAVFQTTDGGYVLAGSTFSNHSGGVGGNKGESDVYVVRTDAYGNMEWQKNYGGNRFEFARAIVGTADGGFVIAGNTDSDNNGDVGLNRGSIDIWVIKIDANGKLVWQRIMGGMLNEYVSDLKATPNGGFIVAGTTDSNMSGDVSSNHGNTDAWVVKLDADGGFLWQKAFGGEDHEFGSAITLTADGGFVLTGGTWSDNNGDVGPNKGLQDLWVIRADAKGKLLWQKTYGGTGEEHAEDFIQCEDGGYLVVGNSRSDNNGDVGANHGYVDIWVLKLDASGNLQWQKLIGGSGGEAAFGIVKSSDGGYIIAGNTDSRNNGDVGASKGLYNIWLVKLSASGAITGQELIGLNKSRYERDGYVGSGSDIISVSGSYLVLAGKAFSPRPEFGELTDMYIVKTKEP